MSDQPKRLYRSRTNKVIAGVCGGVAEYLDIDPTLVRIIWVLFAVFGGGGVLLYIAALIIVPQNPGTSFEASTTPSPGNNNALAIVGVALMVVGVFVLFVNLDFFSFRQMFRFFWSYLFPILLIGGGVYLLARKKELSSEEPPSPMGSAPSTPEPPEQEAPPATGRRKRGSAKQNARESTEAPPQQEQSSPPRKRQLLRSLTERKWFGVCGGLGEYFDIDPTMVRILFVIITIMSGGFGVLLYIILLLTMPEKPRVVAS